MCPYVSWFGNVWDNLGFRFSRFSRFGVCCSAAGFVAPGFGSELATLYARGSGSWHILTVCQLFRATFSTGQCFIKLETTESIMGRFFHPFSGISLRFASIWAFWRPGATKVRAVQCQIPTAGRRCCQTRVISVISHTVADPQSWHIIIFLPCSSLSAFQSPELSSSSLSKDYLDFKIKWSDKKYIMLG